MKSDWISCDGGGQPEIRPAARTPIQAEFISRRSLLAWASLGLLGPATALGQVAINPQLPPATGEAVVVIFLRGGADGLNMVVPYEERGYYDGRPSLALKKSDCLALNDQFGLHPSLRAMADLFESKELAIFHATGSGDQTRSHFEAMSAMERGLMRDAGSSHEGWIARYLTLEQRRSASPLRAVALSTTLPDSLRGGPPAIVLNKIDEFKLNLQDERWLRWIEAMYAGDSDEVIQAGGSTVSVIQTLAKLAATHKPGKSKYPASDLGRGLEQVALLIKSGIGLEIACLDKGGWDTHVGQGQTSGWMPGLLADLADSIAAFLRDLGEHRSRTTVIVQTEFGRRLSENSGLGTDHGRGSVMFVLGGSVKGGRVLGDWPGLDRGDLEGPGDLRVTTDYRSVLSQVLQRKLGATHTDEIFVGAPRLSELIF